MVIHVKPLAPDVSTADLHALFSAYGRIESTEIPVDEPSGRPLGFGFVLMPSRTEGAVALEALRGHRLEGRTLSVREAYPGERSNRHKANEAVRGRRFH